MKRKTAYMIAVLVTFVILVIAGLLIYVALQNHVNGDQLSEADSGTLLFRRKKPIWCEKSENTTKKYGIVLDGGGPQTCAVYFSWNGCVSEEDICCPKGSMIHGDPENHVKKVMVCIKRLMNNMNSSYLSETPIYFGGTDDFRLLRIINEDKANNSLNLMKSYLLKTNMSVKEVGIITGRNESLYRWIATNYMRNVFKIKAVRSEVTYGTIYLSELSAQISFDHSTIQETQNLKLYGNSFNIFTQSNMCSGTETARERHRSLLITNITVTDVEDPCYPKNLTYTKKGVEMFWGICTLNRRFTESLRKQPGIANQEYTFRGTGDSILCKETISKIFDKAECERRAYLECFSKIRVPKNRIFLAYSELYSIADSLNLTRVTLEEFNEKANSLCHLGAQELNQMSHLPRKKRFQLCFNAQYISELLLNGYGFNKATWRNINFIGHVNETDVTWTLGYMINAVNHQIGL